MKSFYTFFTQGFNLKDCRKYKRAYSNPLFVFLVKGCLLKKSGTYDIFELVKKSGNMFFTLTL